MLPVVLAVGEWSVQLLMRCVPPIHSRTPSSLFVAAYPEMRALDVMHLTSPFSAILSAVIFNALIIILLIPLALRGVPYRPLGAAALLRRSLLIYGVGGVVAPFVGIKALDLILQALGTS